MTCSFDSEPTDGSVMYMVTCEKRSSLDEAKLHTQQHGHDETQVETQQHSRHHLLRRVVACFERIPAGIEGEVSQLVDTRRERRQHLEIFDHTIAGPEAAEAAAVAAAAAAAAD